MTNRINDISGQLVIHGREMPSFMANVKPYEFHSRHVSWQGKLRRMSDKPFVAIAERIRWHRETFERKSQQDYAQRAGLKRSQISNWETGDQRVSLDGARALRQTYGLSLDFIYEGIDDALPMTLRAAWRDRPTVSASR